MKGNTLTLANALKRGLALALFSLVAALIATVAAIAKPAPSSESARFRSFWVPSHGSTRNIEATLVAKGARVSIYLENNRALPAGYADRLVQLLETKNPGTFLPNLGLLPLEEWIFAPLPSVRGGPQDLVVLFTRLGLGEDGLFSPYDQMTREEASQVGERSNEANILYLNGFRGTEDATTAVVTRELQRLLAHGAAPFPQAHWIAETLAQSALLVGGYYTNQDELDRYTQNTERHSLMAEGALESAPQMLFAAFLLDTQANKKEALRFLTGSGGDGRESVEALFRKNGPVPLPFDAIFSSFLSYLFESHGRPLPLSFSTANGKGLRLPEIRPYAVLKSFPAELQGRLLPYSFVVIDLPSALPPTAIVEAEALRDRSPVGSCGNRGSVLWKPVHPTRIAVYAVGCEQQTKEDALQFRLRVLDRP